MKKIMPLVVVALLCLFFRVQGQEVDITSKGIQVGQAVPDMVLSGLHNYKDAGGRSASSAKISDFKGKLLILDFWATWCTPCVAMVPKMDSLQRVFGDRLQFLSVTYQEGKVVLPFMEEVERQAGRKYGIPMVVGDKALHRLFPHVYLPHYVWIDGQGVVRAITGSSEVTADNIRKVLGGSVNALVKKTDFQRKFDSGKPMFLGGNGGNGDGLRFLTTLTGYQKGLAPEFTSGWIDEGRSYRIRMVNVGLLSMFKYAYSTVASSVKQNTLLWVADPDKLTKKGKGDSIRLWQEKNAYCYEMVVPRERYENMLLWIREDFNRMFPQYQVSFGKEDTEVLALVMDQGVAKSASSHKGAPFADVNAHGAVLKGGSLFDLTYRLNTLYLQHLGKPVVNHTQYNGPFDLEIRADMGNVEAINGELKRYGLKFVHMRLPVDRLTIKDRIYDGKVR